MSGRLSASRSAASQLRGLPARTGESGVVAVMASPSLVRLVPGDQSSSVPSIAARTAAAKASPRAA